MLASWHMNGAVSAFACSILVGVIAAPSLVAQEVEGRSDIRVTNATFGGNCGAPEGNLTWRLVQACDGLPTCRYQFEEETVEALATDPGRCANQLKVQWRCGNSPETFPIESPALARPPGIEAGYVLLFTCPPEAVEELLPQTATLGSVRKANRPALPGEFDSVRILRDGERIPAELGMTVRMGDEISTADDTTAELTYPDVAQVTIGPGSRVRISPLLLEFGSVRVETFETFDGVFEVETPYVTARAKGTDFEVTVGAGRATLSVHEGWVDADRHTGDQERLLVKAGETAEIPAAQGPVVLAATTDIDRITSSTRDRLAYCEERAGPPARNEEELTRTGRGPNTLHVRNESGRDAVVKLKDPSDNTVLAFYIAGREATVEDVPYGAFDIVFAAGHSYSRACGRFLEDMVVLPARFAPQIEFRETVPSMIGHFLIPPLDDTAASMIGVEDAPPSCDPGPKPANGQIMKQTTSGPNILEVRNRSDRDAVLELRDLSGNTVLSVFVTEREATVRSVPYGTFDIAWKVGRRFSRECDRFLEEMVVLAAGSGLRAEMTEGQQSALKTMIPPVQEDMGFFELQDSDIEEFVHD